MAYNALSQADLEVVSHASDSAPSRSPSPHAPSQRNGFQRLPPDAAEDLTTDGRLQPARTEDDISIGHLMSMIRSMSSASYDRVDNEDVDEEEEEDDAQEAIEPTSNAPRRAPPPIDTSTAVAGNRQPQSAPVGTSPDDDKSPLRSPISDRPVPLSHPTPGLQSLQGAYRANIERLEMSAERMSASSTDIASEIRRMDLEQKRRSSSASVANSVVVANNHNRSIGNGLSPTGTHPSCTAPSGRLLVRRRPGWSRCRSTGMKMTKIPDGQRFWACPLSLNHQWPCHTTMISSLLDIME